MKISELIERLEAGKKEMGDVDIYFASDEEGNMIHPDCFLDDYGMVNSLVLYPIK